MHRHFITPTVVAPNLIGLAVPQALELLSSHHLNTRIVDYQERDDLAADTIVAQQPAAGQPIKIHCPLLITVTKKPPERLAPALVGLSAIEIETIAKKNNIIVVTHYIEHATPTGYCCAQLPAAHHILEKNTIVCFIATQRSKMYLIPDCKGMAPTAVQEFFAEHQYKPEFCTQPWHHPLPYCPRCSIVDQQPRAGTIMGDTAIKIKFLVGH